jgi:hypothetical protein
VVNLCCLFPSPSLFSVVCGHPVSFDGCALRGLFGFGVLLARSEGLMPRVCVCTQALGPLVSIGLVVSVLLCPLGLSADSG